MQFGKQQLAADYGPEVHGALGTLVINFGMLEAGLAFAIISLAGADPGITRCLLQPLNFRQRISVLEAIVRCQLPPLHEPDIREMIARLSDANTRRNKWVHGILGSDQEGGAFRFYSSLKEKKGYDVETISIDAPLVLADAGFISGVAADVIAFALAVKGTRQSSEVPASHDQ